MSSNSSFFQLLGSFNLVDLDLISNALEQGMYMYVKMGKGCVN